MHFFGIRLEMEIAFRAVVNDVHKRLLKILG